MTVDPRWIRSEVDRVAIAEGCDFDESAGEHVCEFIETFCCQSKGRWAGQPLELLDWQRDFLMRVFSWKRPSGLRRYKRVYLEVAKKNGKSTLLSALAIELEIADGEGAPEIYINACDKRQAEIIFDEAARMVRASAGLSRRLEIGDSKKRIFDPSNNGVIIANSSIVDSKDGLNPSVVIFDELHRQPGRELHDVFEYATAAREQPLHIDITTAGEEEDGVWFEQREYAEKVNAGTILDTSFLGVVYRAQPDDDIDDPATWHKANPSLGVTISLDDFARELAEAKQVPVKLANFKRLRLNIVARGSSKFVDMDAWNACGFLGVAPIAGRPFHAGLDLSSTTDLAALVSLAGDPDDGFDVHAKFWLPEDNIVALERRDRVPYRMWAEQGFLTLTPGSVIDYAFIRRDVNELAAEGTLEKLLIDPYNATKLALELKEQDGLPVEFLRQGFLSLSGPTKELSRLILGRKLRHGGHPILKVHAANAVAVLDAAENVKLDKKKSRNKIDGMAALVNATAGATSGSEDTGPSVYEKRGVLFI